jgi:hypothetical protein
MNEDAIYAPAKKPGLTVLDHRKSPKGPVSQIPIGGGFEYDGKVCVRTRGDGKEYRPDKVYALYPGDGGFLIFDGSVSVLPLRVELHVHEN